MLAVKKMLLLPRAAVPFSISGSYEPANADGWILRNNMQRGGVSTVEYGPRTGIYYLFTSPDANNNFVFRQADYVLPELTVRGLRVELRVYKRAFETGGVWRILASIDGGATFTQLSTGQMPGDYSLISGAINVKRTGLIFRIEASSRGRGTFDDWTIQGVRT